MRFVLTVLLTIAAACVAGCANTSGGLSSLPLPESARTEPDQYLLVTVRNEPRLLPSRAGSTLRGYDGAASYAVSGAARKLAHAIAADYRMQEVSAWPIAALRVHCILYRIPPADTRDGLLARLAIDSRVQLAQPLQSFSTSATPVDAAYNDPYFGLQRGLWEMSVVAAHLWSRGEGVTVAVVDTGVDASHPDLAGRVNLTRNYVDRDHDQFERDRHGTEVAGVIAAVGNNEKGIVGVAPQVQLLALKACWQSASSSSSAVCNSFTLAQAIGSAIDAHVDVINLSLVGPADPLLAALTRKAIEQGSIVVGSVPVTSRMDGFPAGVPGVIAVDMAEQAAPAKGALRAPGRDILTLVPDGHYDFATGSSMAAANVSGIVALMRARRPQMTAAEAKTLLARSTQDVAGSTRIVVSINACVALSALLMTGHCSANAHGPADAATTSVARDVESSR
jgi:hypothetical protein